MSLRPPATYPEDLRQFSRWCQETNAALVASEVLTSLLTVDGTASGIDADLLDGAHGTAYLARANHTGTQLMATISDLPILASGTYTPTLTNGANVAASTAYQAQYLRVGPTITVSGRIDVDATTTLTSTVIGISLPVASNFGAVEDCAGVAASGAVVGTYGAISANVASDRAELTYIPTSVSNDAIYFHFSYQFI